MKKEVNETHDMETTEEKREQEKLRGASQENDLKTAEQQEAQEPDGFSRGYREGVRKGERQGRFTGFVLALIFGAALYFGTRIAAGTLGIGRWSDSQEDTSSASVLTDADTWKKLVQFASIIDEYYLGEIDGQELSDSLFEGIVEGLGDPYARYYPADELESVLESSRGSYVGIGVSIEQGDLNRKIVVEVYEGGAAEQAGLLPGDELRSVAGQSLDGLDLSETVALVKSMKGVFELEFYRPLTGETMTAQISCETVELNYVTFRMLEDQVGYIQITQFTEAAATQFKNAAASLLEDGMQQLVVDLRDNPGGLLDSVCDILDEIVQDDLMVYMEDKQGNREEYYADGERLLTCEVAVLVNGGSASASELFAGAIQDLEAGFVVGTTTYGKGVVQKTCTFSDGSGLKLTVEEYHTASGRKIDGVGISPDEYVEETEAEKTEEITGETSEEVSEETQETEEDPVLARTLEVLAQHREVQEQQTDGQ